MDHQSAPDKSFSGKQVFGIAIGVMVLTIMATFLVLRTWLFPQPFVPVVLEPKEQQLLEQKLERFDSISLMPVSKDYRTDQADRAEKEEDFNSDGQLNPQPYSENSAKREILLTEREINGLLANNSDLAEKMAIDLADNLISLRLLLPLDPDFPLMGGKTIRARAGAHLSYQDGRPVVILKGVSLMGVPLPNAWLGGLKNIDLVNEFGGDQSIWKSVIDGVDSIQIQEGQLYIRLKE